MSLQQIPGYKAPRVEPRSLALSRAGDANDGPVAGSGYGRPGCFNGSGFFFCGGHHYGGLPSAE